MSENSCLQEQLLTKFVITLVTTIIINYINRYTTGQAIIIIIVIIVIIIIILQFDSTGIH